MRGIILAAGRGSRLGGLTEERPKCLVSLAGRPLLAWQRAALAAGGVDELAVVAGYRAEQLGSGDWRLFRAPRWGRSNMVTSLRSAAPWLRTSACVVSYGDIFYTGATVARLVEAPGELAICYDPHWYELWRRRFGDPLDDAERFKLGPESSVRQIGGRPRSVEEIEGQYMGLLRFTPASWATAEALLATLPSDRQDRMDMTTLLQGLIDAGRRVEAVPCIGGWGEVDQQSDLALYAELIATGRLDVGEEVES
jgi:choline kinase